MAEDEDSRREERPGDAAEGAADSVAGGDGEGGDGGVDSAAGGDGAGGGVEGMPPVPPEIREAARLAPGNLIGVMDPAWSAEGDPPDWALVGQWRSGSGGEIEDWYPNPAYRPSPEAMGWPDPTDEIDRAVQLAATGYGPAEDIPRTLVAAAEVAVLIRYDGTLCSATAPDGQAVVPLYTSPPQLEMGGRFGYELMTVRDIMDLLPERHALYLNPAGAVGMTVEPEAVRAELSAVRSGDESVTVPGWEDAGAEGVGVSETHADADADAHTGGGTPPFEDVHLPSRPLTMSGPVMPRVRPEPLEGLAPSASGTAAERPAGETAPASVEPAPAESASGT
ncbi:type VII secretion system-associated protein [Streptomyces sp. NBC_00102]|uniref:type VII secretion system-associated protein n=1 Tax=Streptomyces sp. NBC_00102 TaxID=2975652 RepID=UPI0022529CF0|nr:type VII secretion system-associated protein [Streptomyces sp. NBC_00102]MCX5400477.1 type VII secretion system-associated protein [Streptomyces sp. NBC_00102]